MPSLSRADDGAPAETKRERRWALRSLRSGAALPVFTVIAMVAFGLAALAALAGVDVPLPPDWLKAWTAWVGSVVGIIVAARVLFAGARWLQKHSK